ncbi:hypothetical protein ACFLYO_10220 [Chloroflexota bacterium]
MARLRDFWSNRQNRHTMMWVFGVLGVLALAFGLFTFFSAWNDMHSHAERLEEFPHDLTDADDSTLLLVVAHTREMEKSELRRWQGVMFMGMGIFILGLAYLASPEKEESEPSNGESFIPAEPPLADETDSLIQPPPVDAPPTA